VLRHALFTMISSRTLVRPQFRRRIAVRFMYLAVTAILLLSYCPPGNSQIEIKTEEHSCERQTERDTPACQSAWEPGISAIFLGLATDVQEEEVPIVLDGEKAKTLRLHVIFKVV